MTIKIPIDYVKETFLNRFSIAKPALDLLSERLDDARAFGRGASVFIPAEQRTSIPDLVERHGRLETAVLCATVEHIACAILLRNYGVRGAISRTLPVISTRAQKTFDSACDFLIGRAHTLVVAAVKALDGKLEDASSSSVVLHAGVHIADTGMRKVFGEHYVEDSMEYVKALPARAGEYSKAKAVEVYIPCKLRAERMREESRLGFILFEGAVRSSFFGVMGISAFFAFTHVYAISADDVEEEKMVSPKPSPISHASPDALAIAPYRDWRRSGVLFVVSPLPATPSTEASFFSDINDSRRYGVDLEDNSVVLSLTSTSLSHSDHGTPHPFGPDACDIDVQPEVGTENAAVVEDMGCFDSLEDGHEDVCGVRDIDDIEFEKEGADDEGEEDRFAFEDRVTARYVEDLSASLDVGEVVQSQDGRRVKTEAEIGIECARFMAAITAAINNLEAECEGDDMAWVGGLENVSMESIDIDLAATDVVQVDEYGSEGLTRRDGGTGIRVLPCVSSRRTARTVDNLSRTQLASRSQPTQVTRHDANEPTFQFDAQSHVYPSISAFTTSSDNIDSPTNDYSSASSNNDAISTPNATNITVTATIIIASTDDANLSSDTAIYDTDSFPAIDYNVFSSTSVNNETHDNPAAIVNHASSSTSAFKSSLLPSSILETIDEIDEDEWNAQEVSRLNVSEVVHFEVFVSGADECEGRTRRQKVFKMIDWATDVEASFSPLQVDFIHAALLGGIYGEDIGQTMVYKTPSSTTCRLVEEDADSPFGASASIGSYEEVAERMDYREALCFTVSMPCLVPEASSASVREALVLNTSVSFDCRLNLAMGPWSGGEDTMKMLAGCHSNGPAVESGAMEVKPSKLFSHGERRINGLGECHAQARVLGTSTPDHSGGYPEAAGTAQPYGHNDGAARKAPGAQEHKGKFK
ncbi:hypothetical protein JR316_0007752 [Psilocybe cubensis]|uniref:Uncharacterized protein n=1 Tax=Psilocybe cubensis TaxID=181762 RepID=A0ACB8GU31_PSICU|nr:hypothetical protein JR316_0007752 [Psilocybe cubensis]KAH9479166.1 hypothetical protein JR316_0007752 [Psilocybe cubensis]